MALDPDFAKVSLLLHGDGPDLSTTIFEYSTITKAMTAFNGAKISTTQSKWGGASIFTDGTNDYIEAADHVDLRLGAGDFTIEGWVNFPVTTGTGYVVSKGFTSGTVVSWAIYRNGTALQLYASSNGTAWDIANAVAIGTVAANTWYSFAIDRTGGVYRTYLDTTLGATFTNAAALADNGAPLCIGSDRGTGSFSHQYLDDLRITKGLGRYPATHAVPTAAFPDSATDITLQFALAAPMQTVSMGGGMFLGLTAPMQSATFYSGAQFNLTGPSPQFAGSFGSNIALTGPRPQLFMTGHDATGENAMDLTAPMATLQMNGGMSARLVAPMQQLVAALTGVALMDFDLTAPMQAVSASGRTSAVMTFGMTAPMPTVSATFGSVISVTGPMGTLQASGTGGSIGRAEVTCPLFELVMTGTAQPNMTFDLTAPMPQLGQDSMRIVAVAPMATLVLVGTATVVASYEAYALNLKHAPGFQGNDELTRYTNYPFLWILRYRDAYFGVGAGGLYPLEGTTDYAATPAPITWDWRTCLTDFGTPNLKTVASVYIGGRMGPAATIDLIAGETGDQSYSFTTPRGTTAQNYRQKFGRGVKERYFGLGSAGAGELSIDTLDFNIATLARRI